MEVRLIYPQEDYLNDVQDIPRAFSPYLTINDNAEHYLKWEYSYENKFFKLNINSDIWQNKEYEFQVSIDDIWEYKRKTKRFIKSSLYEFLKAELQINLPYGSLTGVRPTKLYYELDRNLEDAEATLVQNYDVSPQKANLIANCVKNQKNYINRSKNCIGLFINIPFCPSRCKYCSFISTEVFRVKNKLDLYVDCVINELKTALKIIDEKGYTVKSIYVGGGTPTSIGSDFLWAILNELKQLHVEFTVEAGRPDAIDENTVSMLKRSGVTRVSVNPQTFSDETLALVGRKHTVEDFYRTYYAMKDAGFIVNTDLIAGLLGESFNTFVNSVDKCIELRPDNITIHTLSLKRGSIFTENGMEKTGFGAAAKMVDYAHSALNSAGYIPYYMYRQKNTSDNLENTGYTIPGKQCIYNIDMMEEASSIIGVGAGAMSKLINYSRIERLSNPKGFNEYCERINDTIEKKKNFFDI